METIRGTSGFTMNSQCFRHAIPGIAISGPRTRSSGEFIAFRITPGNMKIVFQKYCKTKEPVCYAVSKRKDAAELALDRINNPLYAEKI